MDRESRTSRIIDKIAEQAPKDDAKLHNYLAALRDELDNEAKSQEEREQLIKEYEEAYQKLTAPANRIGVFIQHLEEDRILIALELEARRPGEWIDGDRARYWPHQARRASDQVTEARQTAGMLRDGSLRPNVPHGHP